jgi:hypothetical protein
MTMFLFLPNNCGDNTDHRLNVFDRIGKICLFGRAKMFMDAQYPEIVKSFDPPLIGTI